MKNSVWNRGGAYYQRRMRAQPSVMGAARSYLQQRSAAQISRGSPYQRARQRPRYAMERAPTYVYPPVWAEPYPSAQTGWTEPHPALLSTATLQEKVEMLRSQLALPEGLSLKETIDKAVLEVGLEGENKSLDSLTKKVDACFSAL